MGLPLSFGGLPRSKGGLPMNDSNGCACCGSGSGPGGCNCPGTGANIASYLATFTGLTLCSGCFEIDDSCGSIFVQLSGSMEGFTVCIPSIGSCGFKIDVTENVGITATLYDHCGGTIIGTITNVRVFISFFVGTGSGTADSFDAFVELTYSNGTGCLITINLLSISSTFDVPAPSDCTKTLSNQNPGCPTSPLGSGSLSNPIIHLGTGGSIIFTPQTTPCP